MQRLFLLGLNHQTATLPLREKLAFSPQQRQEAIKRLQELYPGIEAVLLCTCNRVELYVARPLHGHPRPEEMVEFICGFHGVSPEEFGGHLYQKTEKDVVRHLLAVAASLDSMVVGETQIIGQVREAYELSLGLQATGGAAGLFNPLFQRAIATGKEVLHQTTIGRGRLSVASIAVEYARGIFDRFSDKTVLCIGAGKMAGLVLSTFAGLGVGQLLICNRDPGKAEGLAQKFGGRSVSFDSLYDNLVAADIVVSSTSSAQPIITRAKFQPLLRQRRYRPVFLIDIALPRDVEAAVGDLDNVYLYNIDDLQQVAARTQTQRCEAMTAAQQIVARQVEEFVADYQARAMGPVIQQLSERYHKLAHQELERTLGKLPRLTAEERAQLEELARRLVNKFLHDPVRNLRQLRPEGGLAAPYLEAVQRLFALEEKTSDQDDAT